MKDNIPYAKRSKKERQMIDRRQRGDWNGVRPVTRKIESAKIYNRKKLRRTLDDGVGVFLCRTECIGLIGSL